MSEKSDKETITVKVAFNQLLQRWDGFGCNYVEMSHNKEGKYEDYGSFSELTTEDIDSILSMIFGYDGLRPHIIKLFLNPYLLDSPPEPGHINLEDFRFDEFMPQILFFAKEAMRRSKEQGVDLRFIATMYGPPAWATAEKRVRAKDIDPGMKESLATFLCGCVKYLREREGIPVEAISIHNEGEAKERYPGRPGDDFNMYWPPELVVEFISILAQGLANTGLSDVRVSPGETTSWAAFVDYARAISQDERARHDIGLITSHGFRKDYTSEGIELLQKHNPALDAWTTSCSWQKDGGVDFATDFAHLIYDLKINALIPWAIIQTPPKWPGGDPNPNPPFLINQDRTFTIQPSYYYYKQLTQAGQAGMAVAKADSNHPDIHLMAFSDNGSGNGNNLVVVNRNAQTLLLNIELGGVNGKIKVCRTTMAEKYNPIYPPTISNGRLSYNAPGESITTFFFDTK